MRGARLNAISAAGFPARNFHWLCAGALTGTSSIGIGWEPSASQTHAPFISFERGIIELRVPAGQSGAVLRCCIDAKPDALPQLRQVLNRARNDQHSGQMITGLVLLLAFCGWVGGGDEAAQALVSGATPPRDSGGALSPRDMQLRFGARPLHPSAMPEIYAVLADMSRRAGLSRPPALYCIAGADKMNAYALGNSESSAITLTEGLVRGMSRAEMTGILAHEIAHIANNDAWTMRFAGALQHAIAAVAPTAFSLLRTRRPTAPQQPLETLIGCAPMMAQLLYLGLSRIRERDADAMALQLTDDPQALVAALAKLERHHNGAQMPAPVPNEAVLHYFRSHPATRDRVGMVFSLAG